MTLNVKVSSRDPIAQYTLYHRQENVMTQLLGQGRQTSFARSGEGIGDLEKGSTRTGGVDDVHDDNPGVDGGRPSERESTNLGTETTHGYCLTPPRVSTLSEVSQVRWVSGDVLIRFLS